MAVAVINKFSMPLREKLATCCVLIAAPPRTADSKSKQRSKWKLPPVGFQRLHRALAEKGLVAEEFKEWQRGVCPSQLLGCCLCKDFDSLVHPGQLATTYHRENYEFWHVVRGECLHDVLFSDVVDVVVFGQPMTVPAVAGMRIGNSTGVWFKVA